MECMGVASGCGEQEVGVASGSGWNIWVWLLGVVVRRYIDFLILLIPTPLVSVLFYSIPTFCYVFTTESTGLWKTACDSLAQTRERHRYTNHEY